MSELVTIGGQSFIYDEKLGWIDKKTKAPADENLLKLLNTVSPNRSGNSKKQEIVKDSSVKKNSELSNKDEVNKEKIKDSNTESQKNMTKIRTKVIKGVDPVNIGGQRFVYSNNGWIDEKTKKPASTNLIKLLDTLVPTAKESMGAIGEIKSESVKQKNNISTTKINKLFVKMIDEIAKIDSYFAAKVNMKRLEANSINIQNKENSIELVENSSSDKIDESAIKQSSPKSNLVKLGGITGLAALIAVAYDPLFDGIKKIYDHTKDVNSYLTNFIESVNGFFDWILSDNKNKKINENDNQTIGIDENINFIQNEQRNLVSSISDEQISSPKISINKNNSIELINNQVAPKPEINQKVPIKNVKPNKIDKKPNQTTNVRKSNVVSTNHKSHNLIVKPTQNLMTSTSIRSVKNNDKQMSVNGIPKGDLHSLRKWLVSNGFIVGEQLGYDNVGEHSKHSKHYTGNAIDVNIPGFHGKNHEANDPVAGARFDILAKQLKDAGYGVIWRAPGHYNHLHVQTNGPSKIGPPNMGIESEGIVEKVINIAQDSYDQFIKIVKNVGSTDTKFTPLNYDKHKAIDDAQNRKNKQMIDSKTKKEAPILELPDLNVGQGTIHTPKRSSESSGVINQYISYFNN